MATKVSLVSVQREKLAILASLTTYASSINPVKMEFVPQMTENLLALAMGLDSLVNFAKRISMNALMRPFVGIQAIVKITMDHLYAIVNQDGPGTIVR